MNRIVLDETLRAKLGDLDQRSAICDETGRVVGHYVPAGKMDPELYEWAVSQISDEELERRSRERGPRRTTKEVLERLEKTAGEDR